MNHETPASSTDETKSCPYCAEVILAKAIKCRYCQSDLVSPAGSASMDTSETTSPSAGGTPSLRKRPPTANKTTPGFLALALGFVNAGPLKATVATMWSRLRQCHWSILPLLLGVVGAVILTAVAVLPLPDRLGDLGTPAKAGSFALLAALTLFTAILSFKAAGKTLIPKFRLFDAIARLMAISLVILLACVPGATVYLYQDGLMSVINFAAEKEAQLEELRSEKAKKEVLLEDVEKLDSKGTYESFLVIRRFDTDDGLGVFEAVRGYTKCVLIADEADVTVGGYGYTRMKVLPLGQNKYSVNRANAYQNYDTTEYYETYRQLEWKTPPYQMRSEVQHLASQVESAESDLLYNRNTADKRRSFIAWYLEEAHPKIFGPSAPQ